MNTLMLREPDPSWEELRAQFPPSDNDCAAPPVECDCCRNADRQLVKCTRCGLWLCNDCGQWEISQPESYSTYEKDDGSAMCACCRLEVRSLEIAELRRELSERDKTIAKLKNHETSRAY
jgi:hypothetical protein